jgi:hypothetical protein
MMSKPLSGRHCQSRGDLRPIHVTLMAEVEQGRVRLGWRLRRDGCRIHSGIIPRMVLDVLMNLALMGPAIRQGGVEVGISATRLLDFSIVPLKWRQASGFTAS